MTGSPTVLLLATVGITVLLAPSLALFFGGRPDRRRRWAIGVAIPTSMLLATIEWMLTGSTFAVAAFQGALVATAVAVILAVGLRNGAIRGYALFAALWITLVLVPVGYALFDVVRGPLATSLGTLDFGGASILAVCTGTAALALSLVARPLGNAVGGPPQRSLLAFALSGAVALAGWLAVDIGAELELDATTLILAVNEVWAALAGLVGWTLAQVVYVRRATPAGLVAGLFAGSIVVLPASPWLDTTSVVVLGLAAGVLGQVTAAASRRNGMGPWATLLGVCSVPGAVGLVGAGVVARGSGLVFSGHPDLLSAQLGGLVIVSVYSFAVTYIVARAIDRTVGLLGSSRRVDETVVRLYRELNARDIEGAVARLHAEVHWPQGWQGGSVEGVDAVRAHITRQWAEIDSVITPVRSHRVRGGWIEVDVHQVVRDKNGTVVSDSTLVHAYRERAGLFDRMEIR